VDTSCTSDSHCETGKCHTNQEDEDGDSFGDVCDNCVNYPNGNQADWNKNGKGDSCEDFDGDGFYDNVDFCPNLATTENTPEACAAQELCIGKILITETAWAPHPNIIQSKPESFNVDDYIEQMDTSYNLWKNDQKIIAIIPYHLGEDEELIPEELRNYSWTEKICSNSCIGKDIFNTIGKIDNPSTTCINEVFNGSCTNSKVTIQNLGREVGKDNIVYKCFKCIENSSTYEQPPSTSENTYPVNGINYIYYGINTCFEQEVSIPDICPDNDGTVLEGIPCAEITINNVTYYALVRCEPSITSNNARIHICGTAEQCNYNRDNCCESGGTYGNFYHACKTI
jgi:hypothetical protein